MIRYLSALAAIAVVLTACSGETTETAAGTDPVIVIDGQAADSVESTTTTASTEDEAPDGDAVEPAAAPATDSTASSTDEDDLADASDEEVAIAFADCLREGGVDVNDPTVNPDGTVSLASLFDGPPQISTEEEPIFDECGELLDGANFGPGNGEIDQTEIQDQLVEFASCLRDQGLDVTDPDLSGGLAAAAAGPEALFGLDLQDPQYETEVEACSSILAFLPGGGQGA